MQLRDNPAFPTTDWTWRRVIDAAPASDTCQFCGQTPIRYVHVLDHPAAGSVRVGCDCAEDLTQRSGEAIEAEKPLRDRARRESAWLGHADWQETPAGLTRRIGGRECVTFVHLQPHGLWWRWRMERVFVSPPPQTLQSERTFPDADSAKVDVYRRHFDT